jgi:hypothetical protein
MRSFLPDDLHLTWYGVFLGGGFQIEPGGCLVFSGGYSYHWLNGRIKARYKYDLALFEPELSSEQEHEFWFRSKGSGNLGQTGWGQIDYLIPPLWRIGLGAQIHYYSSQLLETSLHEQTTFLLPPSSASQTTISQKLKIRWTSIAGWFMVSRAF